MKARLRAKRVISIMLSIVMIASMISIARPSRALAATPSISNGDMSSTKWNGTLKDWTQDGAEKDGIFSAGTDVPAENGKAKIVKTEAGLATLSSANISGLEAGKLYKLTAEVSTSSASYQNIHLMVRHFMSDTTKFTTESIAMISGTMTSGTEQELIGYFRYKGGDYVNAKAVIAMSDKEDGNFVDNEAIMYVDNVKIESADGTSVDAVDVSYEGDLDAIQVGYDQIGGYATDAPTVGNDSTYYHSGTKSLHIQKDSYNSQTYIRNLGKFEINNGSYGIYTWGGYIKSKKSNAFARIDLDIFASDGKYIDTLEGHEMMLSRSDKLSEWETLTTSAELPEGAVYASYKIVVTAGTADFYVDDLFGKLTETYYYKISDWSDFHAMDEKGNLAGWDASGNVTIANNQVKFSNGTILRKIETLIPGASYKVTANYTGTVEGQFDVIFYDVNQKEIGKLESNTAVASEATTMTAEFKMPEEAMYAEMQFGGSGSYTLNNWMIEETAGVATDSAWTANWVWYPESISTEQVARYFRSHFTISNLTTISGVYLQISCDDAMEIHVNGNSTVLQTQYLEPLGSSSPYQDSGKKAVTVFPITDYLVQGENLLAVKIWNETSYGGAVYEVLICYQDGTKHTLASGVNLDVRASKDETNWYATDLNDMDGSTWVEARRAGVPAYSKIGDATWWPGPIELEGVSTDVLTFNTGAASDGYLNMSETIDVVAGNKVVYKGLIASVSEGERTTFNKSTVTGYLYNNSDGTKLATIPVSLEISSGNQATFTYTVPDYLPTATYALRLDKTKVIWCWNTNNQFGLLNVTESSKEHKNVAVTQKENGTVGFYVDEKETSPIMYLRPHMEGLYHYQKMSNFADSDVAIYATYNGFLDGMDYTYSKTSGDSTSQCIWKGWDDVNNQPEIDTWLFDYEIMRTLDLNQDANILVQIGVDAPAWWMEQHEDQLIKNQDGTIITSGSFGTTSVSMSSTLYQTQVKEVLKALVDHMEQASYAHRIIGVRLVAGRTFEWMYNGVESEQLVDYSDAALAGFRAYLTDLYGNDAALQSAWGDSSTLTGATIPTLEERNTTDSIALLNPGKNQKVIDYNNYLGEATATHLLACSDAVKNAMDNKQWVVGAYNGYLWNFYSSEAIGSAHTSTSKVLASDSIDFIASPANYSERIDGYATGNMALSDSVLAAGKLYMIEQDNRTYLSGSYDDGVGAVHTVSDSEQQITRDMSIDFVRGEGLWFYDMEGGWFNDDSIEKRIQALKKEWDKHLDIGSNNEVALYVAEKNYNYMVADIGTGDTSLSTHLFYSLYQEQRRELAAMGVSYDTFAVEDVLNDSYADKWSQYKLHIVLSPFELTTAEGNLLKSRLGQNGAVLLWVYLPGASTGGDYSGANISNLVGMDVTLEKAKRALWAKTADGVTYGNTNAKTGPWAYITDSDATAMAFYKNGKTAAAYVDNGNYISAYSAVPDVPAEMLRTLGEKAGIHFYSEDMSDVIETNNSYISVHSAHGGEKTILLPENWRAKQAYDVLNSKYVDISDGQFTYNLESGDTKLFRIEGERSEEVLFGDLDWDVVKESIDNTNVVMNGTFDAEDGSANIKHWDNIDLYGEKKINVINNGDFENITANLGDHWGTYVPEGGSMNRVITSETGRNGSASLQIEGTVGGYTYYTDATAIFKAGKEYTVVFWAKTTGDIAWNHVNINTGWANASYDVVGTQKDLTEWTRFSYTFTPESEVAWPQLGFQIVGGTNGILFIDDFSIGCDSIPKVAEVVDTLYDRDFDTDYSEEFFGWYTGDTTTSITNVDGDNAIAFKKGANSYITYYGTPLEKDITYTVKCMVKASAPTYFRVLYDIAGSPHEIKTVGTEWTEYTFTFTASAAYAQPSIYFGIMDDTDNTIYIDDVSIKSTETRAISEVKKTPLYERNFDTDNPNDLEGWNVDNTNTSIVKVDDDQAISFKKGANSYMTYYGTPLEKDTTYTVSCMVKASAATYFRVLYDIADSPHEIKTVGTDWTEYTFTFTASAAYTQPSIYFGIMDDTDNTIYIDDLSIVKEETIPAYEYNDGVGKFGYEHNGLLLEETNSTVRATLSEALEVGEKYEYTMLIKHGATASDFEFICNAGGNQLSLLSGQKDATEKYQSITGVFEATEATNVIEYLRSGTGCIYLDSISIVKLAGDSLVPSDSLVMNGNTLDGWDGAESIVCFGGTGATGTTISKAFENDNKLVAGATYVLSFRADLAQLTSFTVTVGNVTLSPKEGYDVSNGWHEFIGTFIPSAVGNQRITFTAIGGNQKLSLDDVAIYRKFELGDSNGDNTIDSADLVRYKRILQGEAPATQVFSDFDGTKEGLKYNKEGITIDKLDVKAARKYIVMREKTVDQVANGDFSDTDLQLGTNWSLEGGVTPVVEDGALKITRANDTNTYVKYTSATPIFEVGQTYTVTYRAKSTGNATWRNTLLNVIDTDNWQVDGKDYTAEDWTWYSFTFTATKSVSWPVIGFQLVSGDGCVYVDDLSITHPGGTWRAPRRFWSWLAEQ